jgi:hypothetical protein
MAAARVAARPLLSMINDGLLSTNLPKTDELISHLVVEIESINQSLEGNTAVTANPDMARRARDASMYVKHDLKTLILAQFAASDLSNIIDEIKENTKLRSKSHQDVQQLAKGTHRS